MCVRVCVPIRTQNSHTSHTSYRLQAIQTVQDMGWKDANPSLTRQEKDMLSGTFVNFLPGILQAMTKVAKGSSTQGSKITGVSGEKGTGGEGSW